MMAFFNFQSQRVPNQMDRAVLTEERVDQLSFLTQAAIGTGFVYRVEAGIVALAMAYDTTRASSKPGVINWLRSIQEAKARGVDESSSR